MRTRSLTAASSETYRAGMLAVADRLCCEFPHLSVLTVSRAMSEVRRQPDGSVDDPDPEAVYRLVRSRLAETAVH